MIYRKKSFSGLSVEMDLKELEIFLTVTIPKYCTKNQSLLITRSKMYGKGLAERYISQDFTADEDELNEIVLILTIFLDKSPRSLPSDVVKQVHSFIGFIKGMQQSYDEAIQSFLKVLWMETAKLSRSKLNNNSKRNLRWSRNNTSNTGRKRNSLDDGNSNNNDNTSHHHQENINTSLTTHRLALMYGKNRNYSEATVLLGKVIKSYKNLNVKEHHRIYIHAKESLSAFRGDFTESSSAFSPERSTLFTKFNNKINRGHHVTVESIRNLEYTKSERFFGGGRRRSM